LKFLESKPVESLALTVIFFYTIFVLFWLVHAEFNDGVSIDPHTMSSIDSGFLYFFITEILLKTFASNMMYLYDAFNMFDAVIVVLSLVLNELGFVIQGLGVLRLIRVVVIIMRKITGNTSKLRH